VRSATAKVADRVLAELRAGAGEAAVPGLTRELGAHLGEGERAELAALSAEAAAAAKRAAAKERKRALTVFTMPGDSFESSLEHRAWVAAWGAATALLLGKGLAAVAVGKAAAAAAAAAVLAAYLLADLGTAFYHWGVDNYGSGSTPLFGSQIAGFQGHHKQPWVITLREFENRVHGICKVVVPCLAVVAAGEHSAAANCFAATFGSMVVLSQQFHSWSHSQVADIPPAVRFLQQAGLLIGRKMHAKHHTLPFENNYAIVSGLWNPVLDSLGVWPKLERAVHAATGVAPRSWGEFTADYVEQEPETADLVSDEAVQ